MITVTIDPVLVEGLLLGLAGSLTTIAIWLGVRRWRA